MPSIPATTALRSERQLEIIESAARILTNAGLSGLTIKNLAREMKFSEATRDMPPTITLIWPSHCS